MKALVFQKYGSPEDLRLGEVDNPMPTDNQVLIRVQAASINSWDAELLSGKPFVNRLMFGLLKPKKINILGCDIAGLVEKTGRNVTRFKVGDEVYGDLSDSTWGGFAEYCCAFENDLMSKPAGMSFEQAAAIPQAGLLALQGLELGQIESRQNVLINGAGGGVGSFAIQMAKSYGAEVTAVDSAEKMGMMRVLGADHLIDYSQQDFTKSGLTYDLIFDVMAHHSITDYKRALTPQGHYVMAGGDMLLVYQMLLLKPWLSMTGDKKMSLLLHKPNKGLESIQTFFDSGKVTPIIDECYALDQGIDAFRYFVDGHTRGKIVITP